MERLTERKYGEIVSVKSEETGISCSSFCNNCSQGTGNCKYVKEMVEKLAEYEDLKDVPPGFTGDDYEVITEKPERIKELYERKRKEFDDVKTEILVR